MKLFTVTLLLFLCFTQFEIAQTNTQIPKDNAMSNVIGITAEGGATLGITDYDNKVDFTGKASLEYYLPSEGSGNIGLRVFGQLGFIAGKNPPQSSANPTNEFSTRFDLYGGGVSYTLSMGEAVYPWLGIGISDLWFYPKDANGDKLPNHAAGNYLSHMLAYNGDAGVRIIVAKNMSINLNIGVIIGKKDFLDDIKVGTNNDLLYTATAGLSYYFGREKDTDKDGVPDSKDACANTPFGVSVDLNGCPSDADGDGVPDNVDKCKDTPAGVKVDLEGCPPDKDGDGVPDYLDKCADTPARVNVDENGCPLDADGDKVPDYLDKCNDTPSGAKVDAAGCPVDTDGDEVPDFLDKCPNTPKGIQVDADGCPMKKDTVLIKEPGESLVLSGDTNFEFNKAVLLSNAYAALDGLVETMKEHPEYTWEVGGYTDAIGSDEYNTRLSTQRAQAVVDYLLNKGIDRNKLKIVGYGEGNPIATNDTPEGRSMNRRVEIKLINKK